MKTLLPAACLFLGACATLAPSGAAPTPAADRTQAVATFRKHPFSLFIHFGLYSAYGGVYQGKPVTSTYSEQIMGRAGIGRDEYMASAATFDLSGFDADAICTMAKEAGMTQIVFTAKHHDGFCMFRTAHTPRNVVAMGPSHRDPLAELSAACKRHGLAFGVYYSIVDWSEGTGFDWNNDNPISDELVAYECAQLQELLTQYGPVSQLWFDMGHPTPAQSRRLAETVHRLQPACAINGRVWNEQGDFITLGDNAVAKTAVREPWQTPASIEHETWGYRSWIKHPLDAKVKAQEKAQELSRVVSRGGCYILNIGPQGSGAVDPYEREVLRHLGNWVKANPSAIAVSPAGSAQAPPPAAETKPGVFAIEKPYLRLNRNGAGYYHKPTVRSATYDFRLPVAGERQLTLRLAQPAATDATLRLRLRAGNRVLADRLVPVPAQVEYLDLGRAAIPAEAAVEAILAVPQDGPGALLPVAPGTLYLGDPAKAAGPAALWQQ